MAHAPRAGPHSRRRSGLFDGVAQSSTARGFKQPFDFAARKEGTYDELGNADVYALPGNHDWYDGLNSFMGVFVTRRPDNDSKGFGDGRRIGGRRTKQTRSYFALKLPHDWWLIGADAQLTGFIDQGQVAFLDNLAQNQ